MKTLYIVSVDVEGIPLRGRGMDYSTVLDGIPILLDLFHELNIHSSFFVTSGSAQNATEVLDNVSQSGHEIGCHEFGSLGYAELKQATESIKRHLNVTPVGFRAHRHRIDCETVVSLSKLGYKYDSSVVSSSRLLNKYYCPKAPKNPYNLSVNNIDEAGDSPLIEIPISALPVIKLPLALGYIKLFGLNLYKLFLPKLRQKIITMYLHPYDLFHVSGKVDAPLKFTLVQKQRAKGYEVLRGFLEYVEQKFSPAYIPAKDILSKSELVSRGGVEPSISTM